MTYLSTWIGLDADAPTPTCRLGGTFGRTPMMDLPGRHATIAVGTHEDDQASAAAYLRTWAASLIALADELDAAPVPYALATSPRMPEEAIKRG